MKNSVAKQQTSSPNPQEAGRVLLVEGDHSLVKTESGQYRARRAAGCLVAPSVGDLVLLALVGDAGHWVLCVLERAQAGATRISVDGDLELVAANGNVAITAGTRVGIAACDEVSVTAPRVDVTGVDATIVFERITAAGSYLRAEIARVMVVGETLESVFDRFTQRVKRALRVVEETDSLQAGRIDYDAREDLQLRAESMLVSTDKIVKMDSDQIHLG